MSVKINLKNSFCCLPHFRNGLLFLLILSFVSCKKNWLDIKPDKALVVPSTLKDYQSLLDNTDVFNINHPALGVISADNHYLLPTTWVALISATERNAHVWAADIFEGAKVFDWNNSYQQVFYANVVLEGLQKVNSADQLAAGNCNGSALFYRAFAFHNLAQLFAKQYDNSTADNDLGIPLKLSADINEAVHRSSVRESYQQIINDLRQASSLLPVTPLYKTRPSKPAALAMLARTYLSMRIYDSAFLYADSCLRMYNSLLDYNTLTATATNPVPRFNDEVLFHTTMLNYSLFSTSRLIADTLLYRSYHANDLRKTCFFRDVSGNMTFKGSYYGGSLFFNGLAVDEILLIRAECYARKGNAPAAINDLNTLLLKRWKTGTFVPFTAANAGEALIKVLAERRKELIFRGLRWPDLRRLNTEPQFAVTLTRPLNGQNYSLSPGDPKYTLPIPDDEIRISGIPQNPR